MTLKKLSVLCLCLKYGAMRLNMEPLQTILIAGARIEAFGSRTPAAKL